MTLPAAVQGACLGVDYRQPCPCCRTFLLRISVDSIALAKRVLQDSVSGSQEGRECRHLEGSHYSAYLLLDIANVNI